MCVLLRVSGHAWVTVYKLIQLVLLSVFPGSVVLQVVAEGGKDRIFVCPWT